MFGPNEWEAFYKESIFGIFGVQVPGHEKTKFGSVQRDDHLYDIHPRMGLFSYLKYITKMAQGNGIDGVQIYSPLHNFPIYQHKYHPENGVPAAEDRKQIEIPNIKDIKAGYYHFDDHSQRTETHRELNSSSASANSLPTAGGNAGNGNQGHHEVPPVAVASMLHF
jgi:hypothetical protein